MRLVVLLVFLSLTFTSNAVVDRDPKCGKYKDRQLYLGDKGGCYYRAKGKDGKMARVYVDKSNCKNCK
ncbi:MAG: hypothetical protein KA841_05065 [Chitinophagales bacterium]|jgi:hypothetical protein|nr:hypothetical protein [Chitinophagales bacterium]